MDNDVRSDNQGCGIGGRSAVLSCAEPASGTRHSASGVCEAAHEGACESPYCGCGRGGQATGTGHQASESREVRWARTHSLGEHLIDAITGAEPELTAPLVAIGPGAGYVRHRPPSLKTILICAALVAVAMLACGLVGCAGTTTLEGPSTSAQSSTTPATRSRTIELRVGPAASPREASGIGHQAPGEDTEATEGDHGQDARATEEDSDENGGGDVSSHVDTHDNYRNVAIANGGQDVVSGPFFDNIMQDRAGTRSFVYAMLASAAVAVPGGDDREAGGDDLGVLLDRAARWADEGRGVSLSLTETETGASETSAVDAQGTRFASPDAGVAAKVEQQGGSGTLTGGVGFVVSGTNARAEVFEGAGVNWLHIIGGLAVLGAVGVWWITKDTKLAGGVAVAGVGVALLGTIASSLTASVVIGVGLAAVIAVGVYRARQATRRGAALDAIVPVVEDAPELKPRIARQAGRGAREGGAVRAEVRAAKRRTDAANPGAAKSEGAAVGMAASRVGPRSV